MIHIDTTTHSSQSSLQINQSALAAQYAWEFLQATFYENPWVNNVYVDGKLVRPSTKQAAFLALPCKEAFYGGATRGGKMLDVATLVPTPSGWSRIGELTTGDEVFSRDGSVCMVIAVHPIDLHPESYRIVFDDGSTINACADHLWLTLTARDLVALSRRTPEFREKRQRKRSSRISGRKSKLFSKLLSSRNQTRQYHYKGIPEGSVKTTKEIVNTLRCLDGRANHAIPVTAALEMPEAELPINPYVFGAWLGDGTSDGAGFTSADEEVIEQIRACGYSVRRMSGPYAWRIGDTVMGRRSGHHGNGLINTFSASLRSLGLLGNKCVPVIYLRASKQQRLDLLQGLMDTDGTANQDGSVEFCSTNHRIAIAVHELLTSLGHKARIRERRAKLNGKDMGPKWVIKWSAKCPVFRLKRKLARQKILGGRSTANFRYIVDCYRIDPIPMRCITVDHPSGLFLVGRSMIPTHNTLALLLAAAQFLHVPGYNALLIRKSRTDLSLPKSLLDLAKQWWMPLVESGKVQWNGNLFKFTFPSTAAITFGYLSSPDDKYMYKSSAWQFCGFDELTEHDEVDYRYLFSRLTRTEGMPVPLRMRSASNPDGMGRDWVRRRFVDPEARASGRVFVPATLDDNEFEDRAVYEESLKELDPVTYRQLRHGDWYIRTQGNLFRRSSFEIIDAVPAQLHGRCRAWDMAASEGKGDWTVGALLARAKDDTYVIEDVVRVQEGPSSLERLVKQVAELDGKAVRIRMEQEGGSSGKHSIKIYEKLLAGWDFVGIPSTGSKIVRWRPLAAQVGAGNVKLLRGAWNEAFLQELESLSDDPRQYSHDDQIDAASLAFTELALNLRAYGDYGFS